MSVTRTENDRPRILDEDTYADYICPALYHAAAAAMTDAEAFLEELFAATTTEAGYPYWADALGIKVSYDIVRMIRRIGLPWYLQRGGTFTMSYFRELVSNYVNPDSLVIEENINELRVTVPSTMDADRFQYMTRLIEAQKPAHLKIIWSGSLTI